MFIANSVYAHSVWFIDLSDIEAFEACTQLAKDHIVEDIDKNKALVVFASKLSKQTEAESQSSPRALMTSDRARRKFIMLDVDYNPGQEAEYSRLVDDTKRFATKHETPVLIYPTLSYPNKPRCRIVLFAKRLLNSDGYEKAIIWLAEQLSYPVTDSSDYRMTANRNLPVFSNRDQADAVYSTLSNKDLKPLDNSLWKHIQLPKRSKRAAAEARDHKRERVVDRYETRLLMQAMCKYVQSHDVSVYNNVWRLIQSVALDVIDEVISEPVAHQLMAIIASAATTPEQTQQWTTGNLHLLDKFTDNLRASSHMSAYVRPLIAFSSEFAAIGLVNPDKLSEQLHRLA